MNEITDKQQHDRHRRTCRRCSTPTSRICRRRFGIVFVTSTMVILAVTVFSVLSMAADSESPDRLRIAAPSSEAPHTNGPQVVTGTMSALVISGNRPRTG